VFFTDDNGAAIDISDATVGLLVADPYGATVATPTITPGAELGWGTVVADTTLWPYGLLPCQTQVTAAGATAISDTFNILVERGVSA